LIIIVSPCVLWRINKLYISFAEVSLVRFSKGLSIRGARRRSKSAEKHSIRKQEINKTETVARRVEEKPEQ
jgi:hypothetical protein